MIFCFFFVVVNICFAVLNSPCECCSALSHGLGLGSELIFSCSKTSFERDDGDADDAVLEIDCARTCKRTIGVAV